MARRVGSARLLSRAIAGLLVMGGCRAILDVEPPDEIAAASCLRNSDCQLGQKCLFRVCGTQCEKDLDCAEGQRCVNSAGVKACVTNSTASCASVSCPSGLVCVGGTCRTMCADSGACSNDQLCANGACYGTSTKHDSVGGGAGGKGSGGGAGGPTFSSSGGTLGSGGGAGSAGQATTSGGAVSQPEGGAGNSTSLGGAGGIGGSGGDAGGPANGGAGGAPECQAGDLDCDGLTPLSCQGGFYRPAGAACAYSCQKGLCAGECTNNKTQCKGAVFQRCVNYAWQSEQTCTSVCDASAGCVGSCKPGSYQCNGARDLDLCNAQGVYAHDSTCPYSCKSGACTGSCLPGTKDCLNLVARSCGSDATYSTETCAHECAAGVCIGCTTGDGKCPAGCAWPTDGDCLRQRGDACTAGTQCLSNFCASGVCCDKACNGACEACARAGSVGTCSLPNYQSDNSNCGACGTACTGGRSCSSGSCLCPSGQTFCTASSTCVNTATDNSNCGACGNSCTGGRSCSSGTCVCPTGQTYCSGTCVDTSTSLSHCGGCGMPCSSSNLTATCNNGVCGGTCTTGYLDCNTNKRSDGCEVNSNADGANCGTCNSICPYKVCQAGSCAATRWGLSGDSASDANFNPNVMWGVRITISQAGKLAALGARTVTGGVHVRLGLYSNSGSAPFALVAETGEVTSVANGATEGAINSVSVTAGDYWVFVVSDAIVRMDVETAMTSWWYANRTYGAFPSTPPALTSLSYSWGHLYAVTTP